MDESNSCAPSTLAELCLEAVECCGGDWDKVQTYLAERMGCMSGDDQRRFKEEIGRILSFFAPLRVSMLQ